MSMIPGFFAAELIDSDALKHSAPRLRLVTKKFDHEWNRFIHSAKVPKDRAVRNAAESVASTILMVNETEGIDLTIKKSIGIRQ